MILIEGVHNEKKNAKVFNTDGLSVMQKALLRAIGGTVCMSDLDIIKHSDVGGSLLYKDGKALCIDGEPACADDCKTTEVNKSNKPVKLINKFNGGAAIALFNLSENNTAVYASVSCVEAGLSKKKTYMYYEFFSRDFGYVNGDEDINITLGDNNRCMYFTFIEKTKKQPLFLGRIDMFNPRLAVLDQTDDTVTLYEGGEFAFISEDDYAVFDESANEIECERYGIFVSGFSGSENKKLRFVKYDS